MFLGEKGPFISAIAACTPSSSQAGTCGNVRALACARGTFLLPAHPSPAHQLEDGTLRGYRTFS
ncbi:hypothetical protein DESPIG_02038 [Desulfovibrio piger ATCC 29098]|uniref:Uncharacterized protein n=1 Tax=Desulfovibrio piger ATCC 29098 TaxID=411464 RepID=B6WVC2_9BACT|nr:hypothetical protein DESPIG_02038 [Desulfovibrio piger ATCC 29098]